jgi:hypothetical protein
MVSILLEIYERHIDKQYSRKDVSNTKPAPRRRQTTAEQIKVEFLAAT